MRNSIVTLALAIAGALAETPQGLGQTVRSGGDNARAVQQLQQLASERTALQADNAKLKAQLDQLKTNLEKRSAENAALSARIKKAETESNNGTESSKQLTDSLQKSRAQMQELITHFRETAQNLKAVEIERNEIRGQLELRVRELHTCVDHNVDLYEVNRETLDRLDKRGFWSALGNAEPFTQLARARLENLIDDYRYRIDELRMERQKKPAPAAGSPPT
jgi:seryl-tRNA synthetase